MAFRRPAWMRLIAVLFALIAGVANGCAHIIVSINYGRMMPGVYTPPLVLLAGILMLKEAVRGGFGARESGN